MVITISSTRPKLTVLAYLTLCSAYLEYFLTIYYLVVEIYSFVLIFFSSVVTITILPLLSVEVEV
jgi:hypothetical protein